MCFWNQSQSQTGTWNINHQLESDLWTQHSFVLFHACTFLSKHVDGMLQTNNTLCHLSQSKFLFDTNKVSLQWDHMWDHNTCDMTVCLILGGSMSTLHAKRYYVTASINYLAASYDIARGGQNDWLMVITLCSIGNPNCYTISGFGMHCFPLQNNHVNQLPK